MPREPDTVLISHTTQPAQEAKQYVPITTERASATQQRGRQEPVLNSLSNIFPKKPENQSSALNQKKHSNVLRVMKYGPMYFKVVKGTGSRRQLDVPVTITNLETT